MSLTGLFRVDELVEGGQITQEIVLGLRRVLGDVLLAQRRPAPALLATTP